MAYPRSTIRLLSIPAAAIAVAAPALAAERGPEAPEASSVTEPGSGVTMEIREAELRREQRERAEWAEARTEERHPGPYVPVVGKVDYGTAENGFGASRYGHVHSGHDMFAPTGTPLVAVSDAVVADAGSDGGQGNYVHLYDPEEDRTYIYMHMVAPSRHGAGDRVEAGEEVGEVGCTGSCSGDHLHFEIREGKGMGGEAYDPLPELERWESLSKPG